MGLLGAASHTLSVFDEASVDDACHHVRCVALDAGFDNIDASLIASATSELAVNAVLYAGRGEVTLGPTANGRGLEVRVVDHGPGIADLDLACQDGYSSRPSGLGIGLGATRRAVHELSLASTSGSGVVAILRHYLPLPVGMFETSHLSSTELGSVGQSDVVVREVRGERIALFLSDAEGLPAAAVIRQAIEDGDTADLHAVARAACASVPPGGAMTGLCAVSVGEGGASAVLVGSVACRLFDASGHELALFPSAIGLPGAAKADLREQSHAVPAAVGPFAVVCAVGGLRMDFDGRDIDWSESTAQIASLLLDRGWSPARSGSVSVTKVHRP